MHQTSYEKMTAFVHKYLDKDDKLKILDLGSQDVNGSYRGLFDSPSWEYTGMDLEEGSGVDLVLKDPYNWQEIQSNSIDIVISGQAFEHIEFFWVTMMEVSRVLKTGGLCCIIAPSAGYEHQYPVDCWRFYTDGFKALAIYAFLTPLEVYTQKKDIGVEGDMWKDSVLIAEKKPLSFRENIQFKLRNFWLKRI